MTYQWKTASCIKADAQAAGEVCEELEASGGLTPKRLVEASRPPEAPLHDEFEWNDREAAEKYREHQAGHIIRCLTIAPKGPEETPIRAYFPVTERNQYTHIVKITSNEDMQQAMLERALRELTAYRAKYATLKELKPVFRAASQVLSTQVLSSNLAPAT